jgi:hypothetical protein
MPASLSMARVPATNRGGRRLDSAGHRTERGPLEHPARAPHGLFALPQDLVARVPQVARSFCNPTRARIDLAAKHSPHTAAADGRGEDRGRAAQNRPGEQKRNISPHGVILSLKMHTAFVFAYQTRPGLT